MALLYSRAHDGCIKLKLSVMPTTKPIADLLSSYAANLARITFWKYSLYTYIEKAYRLV